MAEIEIRVTEPDVYRWLGELYFLLKRSEMAVSVLDAKLTEAEKYIRGPVVAETNQESPNVS